MKPNSPSSSSSNGSSPWISHFTTDRPVAVFMVFLAAVVFGYFSFNRLPVTLMPELNYPTLTVRTEYPGSAPQEVENDVSRPIEEALGVIGGLKQISSVSRAGVSDVVLEFVWGTDMSEATQDTLEKLDLVFLPQEAEQPLILRFDPSLDPIMELSLSGQGVRYEGEAGLRRLRRIAEYQLKRELEPIKGVAAVRVRGGLEEEIHIRLDEDRLQQTGISIAEVIQRVRQENINVVGGQIQEGRAEYVVRTLNEYENIDQISETVVRRLDGKEIRIKDLAVVERSHKEREIITRSNGAESVQIDIYKEADANMVAAAKRILARIGDKPNLSGEEKQDEKPKPGFGPPGMRKKNEGLAIQLQREEEVILEVVADRSLFIESSIKEVQNTAVFGGALAVLILYLFLKNLRSTVIVAVSIPMSLLITFAPMNWFGVTLNIMSLGGLALGVGMLVDSSIVVLESIYRRREEGDSLRDAAIRGTSEVRGAVFASILTSISVFFPMVFVEGIAGQAFGDLGIAVALSLLASLLIALLFIPMLASRSGLKVDENEYSVPKWTSWASFQMLRGSFKNNKGWVRWIGLPYYALRWLVQFPLEIFGKIVLTLMALVSFVIFRWVAPIMSWIGTVLLKAPLRLTDWFLGWLHRAYPAMMRTALRRPGIAIFFALLTAVGVWGIGRTLDSELLPEVRQGEFTMEIQAPVGTPLQETQRMMSQVEQALLDNLDGIQSLLVTYGYDITNLNRSDEGEHSARFKVLIEPSLNAREAEEPIADRLRRAVEQIPDVEFRLTRPVLFSSKAPIALEIHGDDLVELKRKSDQAVALLEKLPEVTDVEPTLRAGAPEIQVIYDRDKIAIYGLNLQQVANQVRDLVKGNEPTKFNLKDRRIPIVVRLDEKDRERAEDIGRITVNPGQERPIPLSSIASIELGKGPSEIRRVDGRRVAIIEANIGTGSLGAAVKAIERTMNDDMKWQPGYTFYLTGQNEEWENSRGSLFLALGLSVFLVYVIMAAQFESLTQPLIIMLTIPLAFFGAVIGLKTCGISISIVVFLGMIMLAGIVVNNAIVLIDYINTLRKRGVDRVDAIIQSGTVRLRPILMSTGTTVLGLAPMAMGLGDGAEIRTPMAITVIFGLIFSTALTLVIIPSIYCVVDIFMEGLKKRFLHQEINESESGASVSAQPDPSSVA